MAQRETIAAPEETGHTEMEATPTPEARTIAEFLDGRWAKGPRIPVGRFCLGMAAIRTEDATAPLVAAICVLFPNRVQSTVPLWAIADFNDHPATTFEDVQRVCKVAGV